jgi:hypothetical protein
VYNYNILIMNNNTRLNHFAHDEISRRFNGPTFGTTVHFDIPYPNNIYRHTPIIRINLPPIIMNNQAPHDDSVTNHRQP